MLAFQFEVNESFLTASNHPITVPRSQLDYRQLEAAGLDQESYTITYPRGERFTARMYAGEAGYGEYYQLFVRAEQGAVPTYLRQGDQLLVLLARIGDRNYAILEYRE
jgi:hypothetical protein